MTRTRPLRTFAVLAATSGAFAVSLALPSTTSAWAKPPHSITCCPEAAVHTTVAASSADKRPPT